MSDEARVWLRYAGENRQVALLAMEHGLFNASLQNAQQAIEKALKAISLTRNLGITKTHSIRELRNAIRSAGIDVGLTDEECDLLDSVYLPSKYPLESVLPDYAPDEAVARQCLGLADRILAFAEGVIGQS